jgi:hypothetical protein
MPIMVWGESALRPHWKQCIQCVASWAMANDAMAGIGHHGRI